MNSNQIPNKVATAAQKSDDSSSVLPRQGWQDKQAFIKALIKAKQSLEIAEISNFLT
ncbi:hypothetical protein [Pleurocapsa sp. PCC 7319]|uniref:hypothetical protein n=1 Tax=Pleurocapsa sp. PCC 7319 TaxID=118161 RepID=UPI00034980CA|nr:hypothetical protein [Pleurocapsa sp. PCC 7319]